jgi:hypothetical protein
MAAALVAAGLALDVAFDEEVDAALLAAGFGRADPGAGAGAAPPTQATAGSAVFPAAWPPPPRASAVAPPLPTRGPGGAAALTTLPLPATKAFAFDTPIQFDATALARARERKGPLLRAMMAEHARRGVR